ncbi:Arc family DNA binding domain-containing protein [Cyclobacterium jeungdonense]|uniref:Arc family DNA binding domain-containing protein n=1 Tax=Cyclobacterium jeungdonense TaxID=708087 RepID=A0ABT8C4C8_9BACT|nr:Arc family DNA binding domain-containing protein [Cyclobacterium jeungdonense]MDN3686595.1 Arc family DNA binding domain-containing protein [Cyclobacterium jeungdonense]
MAQKKPFALRIDERLMKAVEKWASDEFRSTNGQLEWLIHDALKKAGRLPGRKSPEDKEGND